jgi:hypothetical protein
VLNAEGKHDEALKLMSAAADAEDKTEKSPVTPGPLAPARELYGQMLLERGWPRRRSPLRGDQGKEPNRFTAIAGPPGGREARRQGAGDGELRETVALARRPNARRSQRRASIWRAISGAVEGVVMKKIAIVAAALQRSVARSSARTLLRTACPNLRSR